MITISVHHPEIETFIKIKRDLKKVTGANISIRLSDEFMNAVKNKQEVELRWPVDSETPTISQFVDAHKIWDEIITSAHGSAEPGLLFWDTVKRETPSDSYESKGYGTVSTNPCGELLLEKFGACRLLLVNVISFIKDPFSENPVFDFEAYSKTVRIAQRLMDDIVDLELECVDKILAKIDQDPEPEYVKEIERNLWKNIRNSGFEARRTGTGVTAIGDAVAAMNLVYGSEESIKFVEDLYRELGKNCYRETVTLAQERGAFPIYEYGLEKDHPFIQKIMDLDPTMKADYLKYGRRNIALTTTAPAGSVSILTQTTSGIEPAFLLSYTRRKKINNNDKEARVDFIDPIGDKWQEYVVYHPGFKQWMVVTGKTEPSESPYWGATSNDINWVNKVKVQAVAQKWICHSISNTTNIPNNTSVDVVKEIYMSGWESGCKGVTVYRDGCRSGVLVATEVIKDEKISDVIKKINENHAPRRPKELPCDIHIMTVRGDKWTFFVGKMDDKPYEVIGGQSKYISIPKRVKNGKILKYTRTSASVATYDLHYDYDKGPDEEAAVKDLVSIFENATEAAFTRAISLLLRHGVPIQYIVEQLTKGSEKEDDLFSFSKALSRVLKTYVVDGTKSNKVCDKCSSTQVSYQEGCLLCLGCGNSKCG
jgi:ribonucleoside-diphosphate reductase alpha chain